MKPTRNTILITGGGSGIGRGLAEALQKQGNQVVIAGRRKEVLEQTAAANPGMKFLTLNIEDPKAIQEFAAQVEKEFPALNVLVNNAGIMRVENLMERPDLADAESMVVTNLLGPIRLTTALLPLLRKQPQATVMNVSSGLAFVPLASTPTYCATKAAMHSYSCSLRYQLKDTAIEVVEIIPPYVQTDLLGGGAEDPRAMPLKDYIVQTMEIFNQQPTPQENCVQNAQGLRTAESKGQFDAVFKGLNDAMAGIH
ncbi:MAG: SDR family NAD(P)-dependent oxidoreductase [Acidobacteriaceae bacterium]